MRSSSASVGPWLGVAGGRDAAAASASSPISPNHQTSHARVRKQLERWPHATRDTGVGVSVVIRAGVVLASACPSWPSRPQPQVHALPSSPTQAVW
eukprot:7381052-Prymnesium_polylepis.1